MRRRRGRTKRRRRRTKRRKRKDGKEVEHNEEDAEEEMEQHDMKNFAKELDKEMYQKFDHIQEGKMHTLETIVERKAVANENQDT